LYLVHKIHFTTVINARNINFPLEKQK